MPDFTMPSLGADMESGILLEWLVKPGDAIHRGDPIAVVDTDKAAIEVESFHDGIVGDLLVKPGTRVQVGGPLARIDAAAGALAAGAPAAGGLGAGLGTVVPEAAAAAPVGSVPAPSTAARAAVTHEVHEVLASPPVRHHAAELGVDLAGIVGTGPGGRISRADVDAAAAGEVPAAAAGAPAPETRQAPVEVGESPAETGEAQGGVREAPAVVRAAPPGTGASPARRRVSPFARRLAAELGVDLERVGDGAGPVTADDVRAAAAAPPAAAPPASAAAPPASAAVASREAAPEATPDEVEEPAMRAHRPGRGAIGALMSRAKREIPHYYVATTVDLAALTSWLRRTNKERPVSERIVPAAGILRATALAAREVPQLNGFWVDGGFVAGEDVHLGVAVSVRGGALVAPAIRHAADLTLPETMHALRDLVTRARSGRLTRAEMADPTLTVTDLGDQGVEEVIGVIYAPQVALLGVGRVVERPWAVDGLLGVHPVVRLTLSGDHRATDGTTGARFLNVIDRLLQRPEEL